MSQNISSMGPRTKLYNLARKVNNFFFDEIKKKTCVPFFCDQVQVGLISPEVLEQLSRYPGVFQLTDHSVQFNPKLDNPAKRNEALEKMLLEMKSEKLFLSLKGWRSECYVTWRHFSSEMMFKMERSATPLFGVRQFGVHITGYVNHSTRGLCVWYQRRSKTKQTWPGMLDSFVGGGITEGIGVMETAIKEAGEEANVPPELASQLRPVGSVSFLHESDRGLHPQTEFVFDLELPESFSPSNNDGEVEDFVLTPVSDVPDTICDDNFKTTSAPIALDWLIRHGLITAESELNYPEILELIHLPLHQMYNNNNNNS